MGGEIMSLEKNLAEYIKSKGINLTFLSKQIGVPYFSLYDSLANNNRNRELKGTELMLICKFLDKKPEEFMDK